MIVNRLLLIVIDSLDYDWSQGSFNYLDSQRYLEKLLIPNDNFLNGGNLYGENYSNKLLIKYKVFRIS